MEIHHREISVSAGRARARFPAVVPGPFPGSGRESTRRFPNRPRRSIAIRRGPLPEVPKPAGRAESSRSQRQIRTVLTRWADTLLDDDIEAHVRLGMPFRLVQYLKRTGPRAQIRDEVNQMMDRYDRLKSYKISDVTIASVDADHAIAHFRKRWETADRKYAGEEREEMKFVERSRLADLLRAGAENILAPQALKSRQAPSQYPRILSISAASPSVCGRIAASSCGW